jgi:hypothetical protein
MGLVGVLSVSASRLRVRRVPEYVRGLQTMLEQPFIPVRDSVLVAPVARRDERHLNAEGAMK